MDPIRDGLNWYAYVDNNPVSSVDPTGLFAACGALTLGRALPLAGGCAIADGPLPIGDLIAIGIIGGYLLDRGYCWFSQRGSGNVKDTGILDEARRIAKATGQSIQEVLEQMYEEARKAGDYNRAEKIKRTQKGLNLRKHG